MKIINSIFIVCFFFGCKTAINVEAHDLMAQPCGYLVISPEEEPEYIFYNWYRKDSTICGIDHFRIKDLQGYRKGGLLNGKQHGKWFSERYFYYDSVEYTRSKDYLAREEYFKNGLRDSIYKIYDKEGR